MREGYGLAKLRADAVAGATVAVVALPLATALGIASGASPDKGLITAIVAGCLSSSGYNPWWAGGVRVQRPASQTRCRSDLHHSRSLIGSANSPSYQLAKYHRAA